MPTSSSEETSEEIRSNKMSPIWNNLRKNRKSHPVQESQNEQLIMKLTPNNAMKVMLTFLTKATTLQRARLRPRIALVQKRTGSATATAPRPRGLSGSEWNWWRSSIEERRLSDR